jgi:Protein of unknown function (DUF2844)
MPNALLVARFAGIVGFALAAFASPPASATLGGNAASTLADQAQMKATIRVSPGEKYTLHEIQTPAGTSIKEFVSPAGKVFAVSWRGPWMPNLRQLLGDYFEPYLQGAKAKRGARGAIAVDSGTLVARSGGRMRAFAGRAFVPDLLPDGVSADDIQ